MNNALEKATLRDFTSSIKVLEKQSYIGAESVVNERINCVNW